MKFSIVICTRNRALILEETLLNFLDMPQKDLSDVEFVIVDNASNDHTLHIIESLKSKFEGRLHYFYESKIGIPFARNRGVNESHGDVIAFTDDDCITDIKYLSSLKQAFEENPSIGFMGGKIKILLEDDAEIPLWANHTFFLGPLGALDYGEEPFLIGREQLKRLDHLFYGGNVAFKKEVFSCYGLFNESQLFGEDTEICLRLLAAGVKGRYEPNLIVHHKTSSSRFSSGFFYRWYFRHGQYHLLYFNYQRKFYYPLGIPIWMLKAIVAYFLRSLKETSPGEKLRLKCWSFFFCGQAIKIVRKRTSLKMNDPPPKNNICPDLLENPLSHS